LQLLERVDHDEAVAGRSTRIAFSGDEIEEVRALQA
jgi:hypothetical protein